MLNHVLFRFLESFLQTCKPTCNPPGSYVKAQVFQVDSIPWGDSNLDLFIHFFIPWVEPVELSIFANISKYDNFLQGISPHDRARWWQLKYCFVYVHPENWGR